MPSPIREFVKLSLLASAGFLLSRRSTQAKTALTFAAGAAGVMLLLRFRRRNSYAGARVIVSGGSRGFGLKIAEQFLKEGAQVSVWARDGEELARAVDLLREECGKTSTKTGVDCDAKIFPVQVDITDPKDLDRAFAAVRNHWDGIDVLVNNAGSITTGPSEVMNENDYAELMDLHFSAHRRAMYEVFSDFRAQRRGQIINIVSIGGKLPVPHLAPYCASKFALAGLSETLATEWARFGIQVTTVYPGLMRTGSPIQAKFKGDPKREYVSFAVADYLPGLTVSADSAARQVVSAAKSGRAQLVISPMAKLGTWAFQHFPETFHLILRQVAARLPRAPALSSAENAETLTGAEARNQLGDTEVAQMLSNIGLATEKRLNQWAH